MSDLSFYSLDTRMSVSEWNQCNWAVRPSNPLVTRRNNPDLKSYKFLLDNAVKTFGPGTAKTFKLFESQGGKNLLFSDDTKTLSDTGSKNTYTSYLGKLQTFISCTSRPDVYQCLVVKNPKQPYFVIWQKKWRKISNSKVTSSLVSILAIRGQCGAVPVYRYLISAPVKWTSASDWLLKNPWITCQKISPARQWPP